MFYVYQYIDPRTNLPFYIGKGTNERKFYHLNETVETTINKRKFYRIQSLKKLGLNPIIQEVAKFDCEEDAYQFEEKLINQYGRKGYDPNGILLNISKNSNPPSRKGKKLTDKQRARLRGKKLTLEQREKRKGRTPRNKGVKGAQVAWNKGIPAGPRPPKSEETKEKLRVYNTGRKKSSKTREKMSRNMKGRIPWNKGVSGIKKVTNPVTLIDPNGNELTYQSLKEACIANNLTYTYMSSVNSGKKEHHKNWRIKRQ